MLTKSADAKLQKIIAIAMIVILVLLAALTDWPSNLFGLDAFWRDHALVAGALVSLMLLSSGYLVLDVSLERAEKARDEACSKAIRELANDDHSKFWISGIDLARGSARREYLWEDVRYIKEGVLATHRTLAVLAQLTMSLQSEDGIKIAEKAIHAFNKVGGFISELERTTFRLDMERQSHTMENTREANQALDKLQAAHNVAHNSYADLLEAAGGESEIRKAERATTPH